MIPPARDTEELPPRPRGRGGARRARGLAAAGVVLALAVSPALARGEWYDFYEDALRAIEAGRYDRAVELLEAALKRKKRSGYLRTYGNNYVRYVPHFQLGVAYHGAGQCEKALDSFRLSELDRETKPVRELDARLRELRAECEARLAPPPEPRPLVTRAPPPEPIPEEPPEPPPLAGADPRVLENGIRAYLEGDVAGAVGIFDRLAVGSPRSARVRLLLGVALHGSWAAGGKSDARLLARSRRELAEAVRLDPDLVPDPALCPPPVVALYRSLR